MTSAHATGARNPWLGRFVMHCRVCRFISNHTIAYKHKRLVIFPAATLASPDRNVLTEKPMKKLAILAALGVLLGSALSGCIVVPDGGWGYHHHRDYDSRY
jgi:hypothetical protein